MIASPMPLKPATSSALRRPFSNFQDPVSVEEADRLLEVDRVARPPNNEPMSSPRTNQPRLPRSRFFNLPSLSLFHFPALLLHVGRAPQTTSQRPRHPLHMLTVILVVGRFSHVSGCFSCRAEGVDHGLLRKSFNRFRVLIQNIFEALLKISILATGGNVLLECQPDHLRLGHLVRSRNDGKIYSVLFRQPE